MSRAVWKTETELNDKFCSHYIAIKFICTLDKKKFHAAFDNMKENEDNAKLINRVTFYRFKLEQLMLSIYNAACQHLVSHIWLWTHKKLLYTIIQNLTSVEKIICEVNGSGFTGNKIPVGLAGVWKILHSNQDTFKQFNSSFDTDTFEVEVVLPLGNATIEEFNISGVDNTNLKH